MARIKIHATPAARVAASRKLRDLVTLSVDIPRSVRDGLMEYMRFNDLTKSAVVTKLIQSQLLRKR